MNAVAIMTNAKKKMEKFLDDVNSMLPQLRSVGLSVKDVAVDVGVLPSVRLIVSGSVRSLDPEKIRHLREAHKENRVLTAVLRAVETAVNFKELLRTLAADTVEVHVRLGVLFNVTVHFVPGQEGLGVTALETGGAADSSIPPSAVVA